MPSRSAIALFRYESEVSFETEVSQQGSGQSIRYNMCVRCIQSVGTLYSGKLNSIYSMQLNIQLQGIDTIQMS